MIYIFLALIFICLQAFFSGIEVGLISLLKPRVKYGVKENHRGAKILDFFVHRPGYLLATTLIGTNICVVCSSNMARKSLVSFGLEGPRPLLIMTCCLTLVLLVAEIIPKDWFRQQPYNRCRLFAYPLYIAFIVLFVPVHLMAGFTRIVSRLFSRQSDYRADSARALMREDFRTLLRESEDAGVIDSEAADVLDRSLDFHGLRVGDIFRPRAEVRQLPAEWSIERAVVFCQREKVSRAPVCHSYGNADKTHPWLGIFSLYDAMFSVSEEDWGKITVGEILRPVVSIGTDRRMDDILLLAKNRRSMLLVVESPDEPGVHLGIVTPIDVARRLFG